MSQILPDHPVDIRHRLPPLPALTSVRFFAAIYVIVFHFELQSSLNSFPLLQQFILSGYTGVTLFFVLSGFILAYNYSSRSSAKNFWIARFARVYPVYFISLILALLLLAIGHRIPHPMALATHSLLSFALIQSWIQNSGNMINPPSWTLSVEAFFYALFPILILFAHRIRMRWFLVLQIFYLLLLCLPWLLAAAHHPSPFAQGIFDQYEGVFAPFRLNTFFVGVWIGVQYRRSVEGRPGPLSGSRHRRILTLALVAGAIGSLILLCLGPQQVAPPIRTTLLTYTFGWLLVGLAENRSRFLNSHVMQMGGEISYGMYILHYPIGLVLEHVLRPFHLSPVENLPLFLSILIFAAYLTFRWFEVPARLFLRRTLTGKPVPVRPI
ncbi:MAG: acyltransferase [Acidobacteriota bacterium]